MPNAENFDLDFRPHSYWGPQDLRTHYGGRIKGELRRAAALDLLEEGEAHPAMSSERSRSWPGWRTATRWTWSSSEATTAQSVKVASATSVNSNLRPNIFDARCELDASCQTTEPISAAPRAIALVS